MLNQQHFNFLLVTKPNRIVKKIRAPLAVTEGYATLFHKDPKSLQKYI